MTAGLAILSIQGTFLLAARLGLAPLASKTWLAMLVAQALIGGLSLLLLAMSFTTRRESLFNSFEIIDKLPDRVRWPGYALLLAAVTAYALIMLYSPYRNLFSKQAGVRLFMFWMIALAGMQVMKLALARLKSWPVALLSTILLQACFQRVALYLPDISTYPFAMGWSETSRFYYPALFVSQMVFGQSFAWPILHPSLHFALVPPYLFDAPLWFHRFWQVAVRFE
jgi:hypothetical protein